MLFTETMLAGYAQPLSQDEDQRSWNALNMVRHGLMSIGYTVPYDMRRTLFTDSYTYMYELVHSKGCRIGLMVERSYANNTNVRQSCDVDIAVILESTFATAYPRLR